MFRKTRIKLTTLNACVFFVMLLIISTSIYAFCSYTLYSKVNDSLHAAYLKLTDKKFDTRMSKLDYQNMFRNDHPQIITSLWDSEGNLKASSDQYLIGNYKDFIPKSNEKIQEVKSNEFVFHSLTLPFAIDDDDDEFPTGDFRVQLIRNTNSEKELLEMLLLILMIGNIGGAVIVVLLGFFLSGRALIPIKSAWKKQQQFVSDASHELRTPLAIIQTRSELLLRDPEANIHDKASDISVISNETRRLSRLVKNLLTLTRSDSNQLEVVKSEFLINELIKKIIDEQFIDIIEFQEKTIIYSLDESISFTGDPEKIHQLAVILIDNALKFTSMGDSIEVKCTATSSKVELVFSDSGCGINPEHIDHIFDRFFQGDQSRSNRDGSGLGLSIAKWIIDQHQGKIRVESELGKGSSFHISFPKSKVEQSGAKNS